MQIIYYTMQKCSGVRLLITNQKKIKVVFYVSVKSCYNLKKGKK